MTKIKKHWKLQLKLEQKQKSKKTWNMNQFWLDDIDEKILSLIGLRIKWEIQFSQIRKFATFWTWWMIIDETMQFKTVWYHKIIGIWFEFESESDNEWIHEIFRKYRKLFYILYNFILNVFVIKIFYILCLIFNLYHHFEHVIKELWHLNAFKFISQGFKVNSKLKKKMQGFVCIIASLWLPCDPIYPC